MQYESDPIVPQTLELGGKSPNIFFADVMDHDDEFLDKALEGFALCCFNNGERLHLPVARSRPGIHLRKNS
jgi:aldehyde dehydrogenase